MKANKIECQQLSKEVHEFIDTEQHLIKKSAAQDLLDVGGTSDHICKIPKKSGRVHQTQDMSKRPSS